MRDNTIGDKIFDTFNVIFLGFLSVITIFPFWNVIMTSLVGQNEYFARTFILWPKDINLTAYKFILSTPWIGNGFKVSIIVTFFGTLYGIFLVASAAFGMNKQELVGRNFFITYFMITMYFGGGLIPYYLVVTKYLGLGNSLLALTICGGLNVWGFMVLRTFFKEIPDSLPESARIDGANEYVILFRIMVPLSLPALATLTLFSAVGAWNNWFQAMIFIHDENKYPLQLIVRKMILESQTSNARMQAMSKAYQQMVGGDDVTIFVEAVKAATLTVVTVPIMAVYPFLQKYFAKGVLIGSVKA